MVEQPDRVTWRRPLRRFDINDLDGRLYLRRWALWLPLGRRIMLHHMVQRDQGRCLHDHPWAFATVVLRGGYTEEYIDAWGAKRVRWNPPGTVRRNPAQHKHRVAGLGGGDDNDDGPPDCWTLVWRGRRVRKWGFWTKRGWVRWDTFLKTAKQIPWCKEED